MKKNRKCMRILMILLLGALLFVPRLYVSAESSPEDTQFDIEVHYGFEDTVRIGEHASFHVSLYNKGEAFKGSVCLMTAAYEEDGYYYSSVTGLPFLTTTSTRYYDNSGYEKLFEIGADAGKTIRFDLPFDSCAPFIKVLVKDEQGETVTEKIIRVSIRSSGSEILVGTLTDEPESLEYLDGMHLEEYSGVSVSLVCIGTEQLQDTCYGLDMLDIVLMQSYEMENLKKEQREALEKWVRQGGTLVLGGDTKGSKVLGTADKKLYGSGQILSFSESFAHLESADMHGVSIVSDLMEEIYTAENLADMDSGVYYFTSEEYWNITGRVSSVDKENIPGLLQYVIVLAVYILLAGPVVYLVLKKLRVRKYLWGCVAGFSVIFSMVIFLLGSATRFTAPFINYVKTISLDDRYMDEQIELSVRAPYNEPYQVYVNNEYDIFPVTEIDYYNSMDIPAGNFDRESVRVVYGEKENRLDIGASPAFTEKYFRAERTKELTEDPIQGELNYFDSELTGTLHNASGYDLKNCFLFFRNHLVYVGDFPAGSSQDMGELKMYFFSPGYGYKLIKGLLEVPEGYVKDVTEEFLDINWKYSLLNECLIEGYHSGEERCMLIGFTEDEPMELMKDSAYRMYGQTMVVTDISLEMERVIHGSKWEYDPFVTSTAQVISGNYGTYENICYSQETVLEYKLPENLQYMQVEFVDEKYFDEETYRAFGGDIEIYHPDSKHYEKLSGSRGLDWSELKECITDEGTLLVKFRRKSDSQEKYEKLPVVITRGRRIYAED